MNRSLRLVALVLAAAGLTACSSPTAPSARQCTPTKDSPCTNVNYVNPNVNYVNPNVNYVNPNV
jgi:hypothetical protein